VTVGVPAEKLFYWSHGSDNQPLLLCLHGIGSCADAFLDQRTLADEAGYRLVAWDAPGYRYSPDPSDAPGLSGWADSAAELIRELGYSQAIVLGVSWGGVTATRLAMRHPELVAGLILADSSVGSGTTISQAKLMRGRASVLEEKGATAFAQERSHLLVAPGTAVDVLNRVEKLFAESIRMPAYGWACDSMAETDHSDMLENVKAPTLVVYGAQDIVTPPEASRVLANGISRSVLKEINAAGHLANQEQPAAFNESVISFLNLL